MKKNKKRIGRLCVAFSSLIIVALLATAAVFISTSAAEAVSDSDTLASKSDVTRSDIALLSDEIPADLGEPQIVMNMTDESIGQSFEVLIDASKVWIDWGDGNPEYYEEELATTFYASPGVRYKHTTYSGTIKGATVNIYTDESIKLFYVYGDFISLDVSKLSALEVLGCLGKEQFTTLDVSNNVNLKYLYFGGVFVTSSISSIDISNNKELIILYFVNTNITSLDLSENTKLEILSCYNSKLSSLNTSNNTQLRDIYCFNNNLSELDISNNKNLISLICNGNKIKSLDTSKNSALQYLICGGADSTIPGIALNPYTDEWYYENVDYSFFGLSGGISGGNNITKLDVSNNPNLKYLYCEENNLKFSTINLGDVTPENFSYKNQSTVSIASSIEAGKTIDLSSEYDINGTKTVYKWFDSSDNEVIPTKSENGVFTFGDEFIGQTLYGTMTNDLFPDLTLKTTEVEIQVNLGEPQIVMTTSKAVGEEVEIGLDLDEAYIDWGDGNIELYRGGDFVIESRYHDKAEVSLAGGRSYKNTLKGSTIKIYSKTDITVIYTASLYLTDLNVDNCEKLEILACNNNKLKKLNISNNTALMGINCADNQLTELNVTKNTRINNIICQNNKLTSLDISQNADLFLLICFGNSISKLDASKNSMLYILCCGGRNISIPDIMGNYYSLDEYYGYAVKDGGGILTSLDVSNSPYLKYLWCEENNLKFSTINLGDVTPENFSYKNQSTVSIASSIEAGKTIDLSSEYDIDGTKTVYKWFDSSDNEVIPTKSENGVFTFGDEFIGQTLYGTMTNALYPDLTLETTEVEVEEGGLTIEDNVGIVEEATPSDGIVVRDEHGNIISLGKVKLVINHIEESKKKSIREAIEKYNTEFNADSDDCALFDISLTDKSNAKVTIEKDSGKIKIRIKYPQGLSGDKDDYKFNLYHQKSDGSIEEIAVTCEPNGIWFYADDFSPYILTWMPKSSDSTLDKDKDSTTDESDESKDPATDTSDNGNGPATGESIALTIVTSCLALLSLAAIGAVIYKKKFSVSAE